MPVSSPAADAERVGGIELESEFESTAVPASHRKSLREVEAVWFGFPMILTNAVPGGVVVALLGFGRGVAAIALANLVMLIYVGLLSHRAGSTGRSFALQATQTFGRLGYVVASGFLATIVVGWFAFNTGATGATINASFGWNQTLVILGAGALFIAITFVGIRAMSVLGAIAAPLFILVAGIALVKVAGDHDLGSVFSYGGVGGAAAGSLSLRAAVSLIMATFADSGTMTADFTRWSRNGREGVLAAFTAFPGASMGAQLTGGVVVAAGPMSPPRANGGHVRGPGRERRHLPAPDRHRRRPAAQRARDRLRVRQPRLGLLALPVQRGRELEHHRRRPYAHPHAAARDRRRRRRARRRLEPLPELARDPQRLRPPDRRGAHRRPGPAARRVRLGRRRGPPPDRVAGVGGLRRLRRARALRGAAVVRCRRRPRRRRDRIPRDRGGGGAEPRSRRGRPRARRSGVSAGAPSSRTAAEPAAAVRRREPSPVDVVEAVHRRMDRLEPR